MQIKKLLVEMDAREVVTAITSDDTPMGHHKELIEQCKISVSNNWKIEMHHASWIANKVADWFTKTSKDCMGDFVLFQDPPENLIKIVEDDKVLSENM